MNNEHITTILAKLAPEHKEQFLNAFKLHGYEVQDISAIYKPTFKIKSIIPQSAYEMHCHSIQQAAATKKWKLSDVLPGKLHFVIKTTDARNNQHSVDVYRYNKEKLLFCNCSDFDSTCQHTELIRLIFKDKSYAPELLKQFNEQISKLPSTCQLGKCGVQYNDALTGEIKIFGGVNSGLIDKSIKLPTSSATQFTPIDLSSYNLKFKPFEYQVKAIEQICDVRRVVCAMPVGSGKTYTALISANILKINKMLIVAPKSLLTQWEKEIKIHTGYSSKIITSADTSDWINSSINIGITTYQTFIKTQDLFDSVQLDMVCADEVQFVRNGETKAWKALSRLKSEIFLGLSGTAIENNMEDLFYLLNIAEPKLFNGLWRFQDQYQVPKIQAKNKILFHGLKNKEELKKRVARNLYISESELSTQPIISLVKSVSPTTVSLSESNQYWKKAKDLLSKSLNSEISFKEKLLIQGYLLKARQAASDICLIDKNFNQTPAGKTAAIIDLVQSITARNEKVIIYSEWVEYLQYLAKYLDAAVFHGQLSIKQRAETIELFKNSKSVLLCSDAGGIGLDGLQHVCCNIIHAEPSWNPAKRVQRNARLNRIGQSMPVNEYCFITTGTIEEHVAQASQDKNQLRNDMFYSKE